MGELNTVLFWGLIRVNTFQSNYLGLIRTHGLKLVPEWAGIGIPALLAVESPVAQWLEHPNLQSSEGCEFDSHLELVIFAELSGIRILLLPNYIVQSWSFTLLDGRFLASPRYSPL